MRELVFETTFEKLRAQTRGEGISNVSLPIESAYAMRRFAFPEIVSRMSITCFVFPVRAIANSTVVAVVKDWIAYIEDAHECVKVAVV